MQCSLLAKHELSGAFLPRFKSQGRSQRVGQTEVTARPPWEPLQMREAQDRVGTAGKWGGSHTASTGAETTAL